MKRDNILKVEDDYPLNQDEKNELNALIELITQAQKAQDILYTSLVNSIAQRYELTGSTISLNIDEVINQGSEPKLIVS